MSVERQQLDQLIDAMFSHDERGRLTGAAPLLHIVRTTDDVICRCHSDLPNVTSAQIEAVAVSPRGRHTKWAEDYARYLSLLAEVAGVTAIRAGPLFRFPEVIANPPGCVEIDAGNAGLLMGSLDEWVEDVENGALMAAALEDGRAASVCATVRANATVHCAGVGTAQDYRGRGFAARAVAAWAGLVRADGAEPYYATTFDNVASQRVAHRLGLRPIASEFSLYGETPLSNGG